MATSRALGHDYHAAIAGADLSAKMGFLAHIDTDGELVLAGNAEQVLGVITESAVLGASVTVQVSGVAKAKAGAAITAGAPVMSNADGEVITATGAGAYVFGYALTGADDNDIVEIMIDRGRMTS